MHSDWINTEMRACVHSDLSELLLRSSGHFCCLLPGSSFSSFVSKNDAGQPV